MTGSKIRIPDQDVALIRDICMSRTNGKYSVTDIFNDMKKFIREDFKKELIEQSKLDSTNVSGGLPWEDVYEPYKKFLISETSLKSAFYGNGVSKKFILLPAIVDLYIKRFRNSVGENIIKPFGNKVEEFRFSPGVEARIADMVNSFCSFIECGEPTKAAALNSASALIVLGRACMIYGPVKDAPRYEPDIKIDFNGTDNGIWLCSKHADMVNGDGWADYPATRLLEWRNLHHTYVYERVTGIKKILGLGFHFESGGARAATDLLHYINNQKLLFMKAGAQPEAAFTKEINNFRDYLSQELEELKFPVFLAKQVSGIVHVCNAFVTIAQNPAEFPVFEDVWLIFRKVIGDSLDTIAKKYKVQMPAELCVLIPASV